MNPGIHIAVDEALLLWKGRLIFRQIIKTKKSRFGIKAFLHALEMPNGLGIPGISKSTMGSNQTMLLMSPKQLLRN